MSAMLRSNLSHALGAFFAMGGWALFANRAHPAPEMGLAALVQGVLSACVTLGMKQGVEAGVARLRGWPARLLPPLACGVLSVSLLSLVHRLAGTPEVLATIAVPVTVATSYAALYTQALIAQRSRTL